MEVNFMEILTAWLHLLAAVIWTGGIIYTLYIAMPAARGSLGPDAGKLMGEVSKRFTPVANYCILLIVLTGAALTWMVWDRAYLEGLAAVLYLKFLLASMMIGIHLYRGLLLAPKVAATGHQKPGLQKLSLNLVKVNLWAGVAILLLSAAAR